MIRKHIKSQQRVTKHWCRCQHHYWGGVKYQCNKKVLLRERKRHTARRVAIAISCYSGGGSLHKNFFSGLNMYQAKSGVKNFSLYWGGGWGGPLQKIFFRSEHVSRFGRGCSRLFSKLMASDDVPVCSCRSWPWRAGSHAGSLRPVVLVAFTNVILTARRASRLSDHWLLSRLWARTCHSERWRNNNYNINLVVKIVEGSQQIPGARDDLGLSLRSENDSWVANPMYTRPTESPRVQRDLSIYSFLGSGAGAMT